MSWITPDPVTTRRSPACSMRWTRPRARCPSTGAPSTRTSTTCQTPRTSGAPSASGSWQPARIGAGGAPVQPPGGVVATGISSTVGARTGPPLIVGSVGAEHSSQGPAAVVVAQLLPRLDRRHHGDDGGEVVAPRPRQRAQLGRDEPADLLGHPAAHAAELA